MSFTSSASCNEPGCSISTYSWDLGTDAYDITNETTSSPSCKYSSAGDKTVELTVTCAGGALAGTVVDTEDITVVKVQSVTQDKTVACVEELVGFFGIFLWEFLGFCSLLFMVSGYCGHTGVCR